MTWQRDCPNYWHYRTVRYLEKKKRGCQQKRPWHVHLVWIVYWMFVSRRDLLEDSFNRWGVTCWIFNINKVKQLTSDCDLLVYSYLFRDVYSLIKCHALFHVELLTKTVEWVNSLTPVFIFNYLILLQELVMWSVSFVIMVIGFIQGLRFSVYHLLNCHITGLSCTWPCLEIMLQLPLIKL